MKLLHVDASARGEWSNSRALSRYFVELLRQRRPEMSVDYLDIAVDTPAHVDAMFTVAMFTPAAERTAAMNQALEASDALCRRLLAADAFVFAMPMYNFSMPSSFKAFIDNIVRPGLTWSKTEDGHHLGAMANDKVMFLTTRGADLRPGQTYSGMDGITPALRAAFAFLGVTEPVFVDAQPLAYAGTEARDAALVRARAELVEVAQRWAAT